MPWPTAILHRTVTHSTMEDAKNALKQGYGHGTVCVADQQHAGRGRLPGRRWENPGTALLCTVILYKNLICTTFPVTQLLALAVCRHLEKNYGLHPQIKWPNDVFFPQGKVAGILVETEGSHFLGGIGVNLDITMHFPDFRSPAVGLSDLVGRVLNPKEELEGIFTELAQLMKAPPSIDAIRQRLAFYGKTVKVVMGNASSKNIRSGRIAGINPDGGLLFEPEEGERIIIYSAEIDFS